MIGRAAHTRIWLQKPTTTRDSVGQEVTTYEDVAKLAADRREETGAERIRANRVENVQAVVWRLRTNKPIAEDWRIRTGGTQEEPEYQHIESIRVVRLAPRELEVQTIK